MEKKATENMSTHTHTHTHTHIYIYINQLSLESKQIKQYLFKKNAMKFFKFNHHRT